MAKSERIALKADPDDADDFDVTEAALEQAMADRRERLALRAEAKRTGTPLETVFIPLDAAALDRFRADGPSWRTRINEAVRKAARL